MFVSAAVDNIILCTSPRAENRRRTAQHHDVMLGFSHTKYVRETFGIYSLLSIATRGVLALFLENDQTFC